MTSRSQKAERGATLIELMTGLAVTTIFLGGVMTFLIAHTRTSQGTFDRSDIQRGGRVALALMAQEIELAGLGLPRRLAVKSFNVPGTGASACPGTPELTIASLDLMREWVLQSTSAGRLTLQNPTTPIGTTAGDIDIGAGEWLFVYQNPTFIVGGTTHGHGMVRVGAPRVPGNVAITINSTAYSSVQTGFDLNQTVLSSTSGHLPVMVRARVSRFGVDCSDPAHPYLFWEQAGRGTVPIVRNVDTRPLADPAPAIGAAAGERVGLRFRFHVDADADGRSDDRDGDGVLDQDDLLDADDVAANPIDMSTINAIEVLLRLRSDEPQPDPDGGPRRYRTLDFVQVVATMNMNTRTNDYIFVDVSGL